MEKNAEEILINTSLVTNAEFGESYEFVLNNKLEVIECIRIDSLIHGIVSSIENPATTLAGMLFELNHVRINPKVDNTNIILCLTKAFNNIGVHVSNQPTQDSVETCFRPLGQISDNIRLHIGPDNKVIFLSPASKPSLVNNGPILKLANKK